MYNKVMIAGILVSMVLALAGLAAYHFLNGQGVSAMQSPLPTITATIGGQQFTLEVATTMAQQNQGLSGRDSLGSRNGMLFVFNMPGVRFFWMKDMDFPLDMIWLRGGKIIGFEQNAPTPADLEVTSTLNLPVYVSPGLADKVIEINAGQVAELGLKVGDTIDINLGSQ